MLTFFKKYKVFFITMLVISATAISAFYFVLKPKYNLKIYNPADVNPELVDSLIQYKKRDHHIADFSFVNQNGKTVTQKDYENKIYVADFFLRRARPFAQK